VRGISGNTVKAALASDGPPWHRPGRRLMAGEPRITTAPGSAPRLEVVPLIGPVPALSGYRGSEFPDLPDSP
jgi:hypothetical protein